MQIEVKHLGLATGSFVPVRRIRRVAIEIRDIPSRIVLAVRKPKRIKIEVKFLPSD